VCSSPGLFDHVGFLWELELATSYNTNPKWHSSQCFDNHIVKSVYCLTNQDHRATSCRRKGEGAVFLSSVKDKQSVDENL